MATNQKRNSGEAFLRETKIRDDGLCASHFKADRVRRYPKRFPFTNQIIELPKPRALRNVSFENVIRRRCSVRSYAPGSISQKELSTLLRHVCGVVRVDSKRAAWWRHVRAVPSAGALYSVDVYVVISAVAGVSPGVYFYDPYGHALVLVRFGQCEEAVSAALFGHDAGMTMAAAILFCAEFARVRIKYRDRGYRYALLEAGHMGQNLYLAAAALGLGAVTWGGFVDDRVNALVQADGVREAVLYFATLGRPKKNEYRKRTNA